MVVSLGTPGAAPSLRAWPFLASFGILILVQVAEGMVAAIISPYLQSAGFGVAEIGFLIGVYSVTSVASRLPVGLLYRGRYARWLLLAASVALVLGGLCYLEPGLALPARLLNGLGFGAATTVNFAQFLGLAADQPTLRTRGIALFTALMAASFSAGTFLSGLVANTYGYTPSLLLAVATNLGVGLLALASPTPPSVPTSPAAAGDRRAPWRRALQFGVLDAPLLAFALNLISFLQSALLPLYALQVGLNLAAIGSLRALHALANAITRPLLTGPIGRLGQRRLGLLGMLGSVGAVMLIPSFTTFTALALLTLPMGLARAAVYLVASLQAAESAERHGVPRGLASGLLNIGFDLGALLGPAVGGLLAAQFGIETTLRLMPPLVLVGYLLVLLPALWRQRRAAALAPHEA